MRIILERSKKIAELESTLKKSLDKLEIVEEENEFLKKSKVEHEK